MTDTVIVGELAGVAVALSLAEFETARARAASLVGAPAAGDSVAPSNGPLLSAHEAAPLLGLTARWLEDAARSGLVPCYGFGKAVRFSVIEVAAHFRRPPPPPPPTEVERVLATRRDGRTIRSAKCASPTKNGESK